MEYQKSHEWSLLMEIRTLRYFLAVAREEVISGDSIPEAGVSLFFFLHRANSIRFASPLSFPLIWLSNLNGYFQSRTCHTLSNLKNNRPDTPVS